MLSILVVEVFKDLLSAPAIDAQPERLASLGTVFKTIKELCQGMLPARATLPTPSQEVISMYPLQISQYARVRFIDFDVRDNGSGHEQGASGRVGGSFMF
jgi:hypothetical protein